MPFGARQVSDLPTLYPCSWVSDPSIREVTDLFLGAVSASQRLAAHQKHLCGKAATARPISRI